MGSSSGNSDSDPLFCDRCHGQLHPGSGDHYQVKIEAVADPAPPVLTGPEDPGAVRRQIKLLLATLSEVSAQEAMDQVRRRVTIYLCQVCYRSWIEDPAGSK